MDTLRVKKRGENWVYGFKGGVPIMTYRNKQSAVKAAKERAEKIVSPGGGKVVVEVYKANGNLHRKETVKN